MLIFEIHAPPTPQKQTRFSRGKAYDPSKLNKQMIQWQVSPQAPREPLSGAIGMELYFYMPIPKATSKARYGQMINGMIRPTSRPDIDNLAYIVTNALKELVYRDDSQIVRLVMEKYYGENPKTVIKVWEI
jgi:Holliday junction resolvase RusA-like endonuclease